MKSTMKLLTLLTLLCAVLLAGAVSCTPNDEGVSTGESSLFQGITVTELKICDVENMDAPRKTVTDESSIASFKAIFDGWNMGDHKVPSNKIIDGEPSVCVVVTDTLTLSVFPASDDPLIKDENGLIYGLVNGVPYYMPSAFSTWLYAQV